MNKTKGSLSYAQQIYLFIFLSSPPLTTSKRLGQTLIIQFIFLSSPPLTTSKWPR